MRTIWTALLTTVVAGGLTVAVSSGQREVGRVERTFEITRGTFINLDVSPDGTTIVFDVLGDLYLLPIAGGKATPLLTGSDWDQAPRFSPDGKQVAFISDRGGIDNLWVMSLADKSPRQITALHDPVAGTPSWSADGQQLLFAERIMSSRLKRVDVQSKRVEPIEPYPIEVLSNEPYRYNYVAASSGVSDRKGVAFFSEIHTVFPRPGFRSGSRSLLVRFDPAAGDRQILSDMMTGGDDAKPQLSQSGRLLAYYRAKEDKTEIRVRDLESGIDRFLVDVPDADDPNRWGDPGDAAPTFAFTADERAIVAPLDGRIWRVSVSDGARTEIPFHVSARLQLAPRAVPRHRLSDDPGDVRAIRWPAFSRDRKRIAFSALGSIWIQDLPSGKPRRLTADAAFEHMPAISPDGALVAYISYQPRSMKGQLRLLSVDGHERPLPLDNAVSYLAPAWSQDGTRLAFVRDGHPVEQASQTRRDDTLEYGWIDLRTQATSVAAVVPKSPTYNMTPFTSRAVFSQTDGELLCTAMPQLARASVFMASLDGKARKELAVGETSMLGNSGNSLSYSVVGALLSPDARTVAFIGANDDLWVKRVDAAAAPIALHPLAGDSMLLSTDAVTGMSWQDARTLLVASGPTVRAIDTIDGTQRLLTTIHLPMQRHEGSGTVALVDARVVTVAGDHGAGPILDPATIVIRGRRIVAVGPTPQVTVPPGATIVNAKGLTILPGFHDAHYHSIGQNAGTRPVEDPSAVAFGVTSGWDAITGYGDMGRLAEELRGAGLLPGPRWFFAGRAIDSNGMIPNPDAAGASAARHLAMGVELMKDYGSIDRRTRRWMADAVRAEGLGIAAHLNGLTGMLSRVTDGYTGVEHPSFIVPLYDDVLQLLSTTGTIWTPHFHLAHGTSTDSEAEHLYMEELQRRKPEHLARMLPYLSKRDLSEWRAPTDKRLETLRPYRVAQAAAALVRAGGKISLSGHNSPALNMHLEMWLMWKGGAPAEEVIRSATRMGIEKVGYLDDLGSIEPGKIADLVVLTSDPLSDILNALDIRYTVIDGVFYDPKTGKEVRLNETR